MLSLISNRVRMGSSCLAITRPTIMIYTNSSQVLHQRQTFDWANFPFTGQPLRSVKRQSLSFKAHRSVTYLVDQITVDLTDVIRPRLRFLDHLKRHWRKNTVFPALPAKVTTLAILNAIACFKFVACAKVVATNVLAWVEETLILVCELLLASQRLKAAWLWKCLPTVVGWWQ